MNPLCSPHSWLSTREKRRRTVPNAKGKVEVVYQVRRIVRNDDGDIELATEEIVDEIQGDVSRGLIGVSCVVHPIRKKAGKK
jgi:hypothetical protein